MSKNDKKEGPRRILKIKRRTRGPNMLAKEVSKQKHARRKAGLPGQTPFKTPEVLREKE